MAAFPATSQDQLSLFTSGDGITYTTLASEAWQPPQGLLRDPSIIRADDGSYLIVYTTGWDGRSFGVARSRDLRQWQHVADIPVPLPGLTNVWAPEWFRDADGRLSVIVSLSTGGTAGPFRAYHLQPAAADFTAFTPPRLLQGLDRNPIDTFVVREGGRYVAFAKNETSKFIERAWAPSLDGPWTYDRTGDWAGWGGPVEGPSLVPVRDAQGRAGWRIHLDDYTRKHYRWSDSFDGLDTWSAPRELQGVSGAVRHFTVLAEDSAALQRATAPRGTPRRISWDRHSLMIDGRREVIWAGEFHPFRLPSPSLWRDVLQKMKAIGFNAVSIYFSWGYHSAQPGHYDFTGVRNVERVLQMAAEEGLYVIARPGPYVNAELAGGGFPGWLQRQRAEARTDAPEYQAAAAEWLAQVNAIIARHQLPTGGGTVIAYQLENELFSVQPKNARHMQFLADKARADGIRVPLFHNAASRLPDWTPRDSSAPFANPGPTDLYAFDGYPGGVCNVDGQPGPPSPAQDWGLHGRNLPRVGSLASPNTPGFVAEIGGGWFDHWGSNGSYECTALRQGTGYQRVAYGSSLINGLTIHSVYMAFGGTSWGWQPAPVVFSSYDYGAAIDEARRLRPKALGLKQLGHFVQAATPVLAQMDPGPVITPDNPRVKLLHNLNPALKTHVLLARPEPASNTGTEAFRFTLDTADGRYHIPQTGTLQLAGQDAKLLLAHHTLERQHLVYSSSDLQAQARHGEHDLVLLHGRRGEDGETVLRFSRRPQVQVLAGDTGAALQTHWDAARGDLRLNYRHQGLLELHISEGGRAPLLLLVADEPQSQAFWRLQAGDGVVLALSPALLRSAQRHGDTLALQGDTATESPLRVWAGPGLTQLRFNGQPLAVQPGPGGSLQAVQPLPGPLPVAPPDLHALRWTRRAESPEAAPGFDDSRWRRAVPGSSAAHVYTAPPPGQPVLAMSDHGFHRGDVWYRGRFRSGPGTAAGSGPLQLELFYGAGSAGLAQLWLDGRFVGQHETDAGRPFGQTTASLKTLLQDLPAGEHVLALMVRNMGHNWDLFADDAHKEARGLIAASLSPRGGRRHAVAIDWRLQGQQGGEAIADLVRGPYNNGGLFGERAGWHLPAAPDRDLHTGWETTTLQAPPPAPGTYWLRSSFTLNLPEGHDVQLGLGFGDTRVPRSLPEHRVLVFLNGWQLGQYISHIGPQRVFVLPPGLLNPRGENTLALAVTTDGDARNALESVKLLPLQVQRGGVPLALVPSPRYLQRPAP
ncbi:MAG: beta-galactosidase [Burkholderiales bacterium]|nr:beta-galactosidase [Burkholderiales bacterium]